MPDHHDAFFHKVCSRTGQARALLRCALPPDAVAAVDWDSFRPVPAEFKNGRLQGHRADLLFQATAGADAGCTVYLLLEHKTGPDPRADLQLQRYAWRVRQRHRELHGRSGPEPVVIPVLVQLGPRGPGGAGEGAPPTTVSRALDRFRPSQTRAGLDLAGADEATVRGLPLPPLCLLMALCQRFLAGQEPDVAAECLCRWADLLVQVAADDPGEDIEALESYVLYSTDLPAERLAALLGRIIQPPNPEEPMSTAEKLIQKGRAEGRAEGRAQLLLRQLAARFGPVPAAVESRVRAADADALDRWGIAVLTAATLADVFTD